MIEGDERAPGKLVYMITGIDEHGDTHILVTSDQRRFEKRRAEVFDQFTEVKANWLDPA